MNQMVMPTISAPPQPWQVTPGPGAIWQFRELSADYSPKGFNANSPNQMQFAPAQLYDFLPWGAAGVGAANYNFFQRVGGTAGVSLGDCNMPQASNVGNGVGFLLQRLYLDFRFGESPVFEGTDANVVLQNWLADLWAVTSGIGGTSVAGNFNMFINGVPQLGISWQPKYLMSPVQLQAGGGVATGNSVGSIAATAMVANAGYDMSATPFMLHDQMTFKATLNYDGTPPILPSTNGNSKIGCVLEGYWYRPAG